MKLGSDAPTTSTFLTVAFDLLPLVGIVVGLYGAWLIFHSHRRHEPQSNKAVILAAVGFGFALAFFLAEKTLFSSPF